MFVDEINVKLIAGKGGDGCTSFHHEKCMPNLGPDGANGGHGASIKSTIIKNGDSIGAVIILSLDTPMLEQEEKLGMILSNMLSNYFV